MKVEKIGQITVNNSTTFDFSDIEKSKAMFGADFDPTDGLRIVKENESRTDDKKDSPEKTERKYRKDGTLYSETTKTTDENLNEKYAINYYRPDGSVYSKGLYKDAYTIDTVEETKYDRKGNISEKKYIDKNGYLITERYKKGKTAVREISLDSSPNSLKERTIYNKDGSVYLYTKYGKKGAVEDYQKGEKLSGKKFNRFNGSNLNGRIDTSFKQGKSGTCYIASAVQSFLLTEKGKEYLDDCLDYDEKTDTETIKFKDSDKTYTYSKEEIKKGMGRLGSGDPDFTALVMAFEQRRSENQGRIVDGGFGSEVMKSLTGTEGETNMFFGMVMKMTDKTLDNMKKSLDDGHCAITAGTHPPSPDTEFSTKDQKAGFVNLHSYAVEKITDTHVYVINPTNQKTMKMTREKFLNSFLTYCTVDLNAQTEEVK